MSKTCLKYVIQNVKKWECDNLHATVEQVQLRIEY